MRISVLCFSRRKSVIIIAVKSGADELSLGWFERGVWVAMSVYEGYWLLLNVSMRFRCGAMAPERDGDAFHGYLLKPCELRFGGVPDLDAINIGSNELFKVSRQGTPVNFRAGAGIPNTLRDVKYNAREAILIDPNFLIIGNLAQLAVIIPTH